MLSHEEENVVQVAPATDRAVPPPNVAKCAMARAERPRQAKRERSGNSRSNAAGEGRPHEQVAAMASAARGCVPDRQDCCAGFYVREPCCRSRLAGRNPKAIAGRSR